MCGSGCSMAKYVLGLIVSRICLLIMNLYFRFLVCGRMCMFRELVNGNP